MDKAVIIAVIAATLIRYFLLAPIVVDGNSMMPTLKDTDRMIVNKISYSIGEPKDSTLSFSKLQKAKIT